MRCVLVITLFAALAVTGATSTPAPAATRLGPDLTPLPCAGQSFCFAGAGCSIARCWWVNVPAVGASPAAVLRTPSAGVITRWRFRGGCCTENLHAAQQITLRAFEPGFYDNNPYRTVVPIATGSTFEIPADGQAFSGNGPPIELPARMPVAANKYVGLQADKLVAFAVYSGTAGVQGGVGDGTTDAERALYTFDDTALALNADLEPDADGDGYGDETQDCTPADPATHVACDPPPTPPPPALPPPVYKPSPPGSGSGPSKGFAAAVPVLAPGAAPVVRADGAVFIRVGCPPESTVACGGFLLIETPAAAGKSAVKLRLAGKRRFSVRPGTTNKVRVKLNKASRRVLRRKRKLAVRITLKPDRGGVTTKYRRVLKLRRRR